MVKNNTPESLTVEFLERIKGEFFKKFSSDVISKAFSFGLNNNFIFLYIIFYVSEFL